MAAKAGNFLFGSDVNDQPSSFLLTTQKHVLKPVATRNCNGISWNQHETNGSFYIYICCVDVDILTYSYGTYVYWIKLVIDKRPIQSHHWKRNECDTKADNRIELNRLPLLVLPLPLFHVHCGWCCCCRFINNKTHKNIIIKWVREDQMRITNSDLRHDTICVCLCSNDWIISRYLVVVIACVVKKEISSI